MSIILNIETSTKTCSVAIQKNNECIAFKDSEDIQYSHAKNLSVYIEEVLKVSGCKYNDINAIAVSSGPGSYTGLRIGVASAKGLCYGLDIPLIEVSTLDAMFYGLKNEKFMGNYFAPMIDARRDEVYTKIYDHKMNIIREIEPVILTKESYIDILQNRKLVIGGDGAEKAIEILDNENVIYEKDFEMSARNMIAISAEKYKNKDFVDTAYFEPLYLKEFKAIKPKNKVLDRFRK